MAVVLFLFFVESFVIDPIRLYTCTSDVKGQFILFWLLYSIPPHYCEAMTYQIFFPFCCIMAIKKGFAHVIFMLCYMDVAFIIVMNYYEFIFFYC
jgi:hypothetical protein